MENFQDTNTGNYKSSEILTPKLPAGYRLQRISEILVELFSVTNAMTLFSSTITAQNPITPQEVSELRYEYESVPQPGPGPEKF